MKKIIMLLALCFFLYPLCAGAETGKYKGAEKCANCHEKIYGMWQQTKHATTFDRLSPAEKKDPGCIKCHTTNNSPDVPGVQCEACHGAGGCLTSAFFQKKENRKAPADVQRKIKIESGLLTGEANCIRCHNSDSPHYKGFDFKKAFEQIKHIK